MNFNKLCSNSDAVINNISDNFSNSLDLFLNNASRSPLPKSHKKIFDDYISTWSDRHLASY